MSALNDIRAVAFDAYGTLLDVHSAAGRHRMRLGAKADAVSATWREKQLEYTWLRSLMGRYEDFARVTADALDFALELHGIDDAELRQSLLDAYLQLDCYPEVPDTLRRLRDGGLPLAILSNGSPGMLQWATASAGIQDLLDAVLSVEEVGIFKPSPRVYQLALDHFGLPAQRIGFLSANGWDVAGAASFGLRVVWVNRSGQPPERLPVGPEAQITDLAALPALLGL